MATPQRDFYTVLGVARDADQAAIKAAFRELALKYHPDRNKELGAEDRFKEIAEAYAVLSDPEKRQRYDAAGAAGVAGFSPEDLFSGIDFEDIFGTSGFGFGGGLFERLFGRKRAPRRGEDIELEVAVSLDRVLSGGKESIRVPQSEPCAACQGCGAKAGTSPRQCDPCKGTGLVTRTEHRGSVLFTSSTSCSACAGRGHFIDSPCPACGGRGQVSRDRTLDVTIPAGIEDRLVLRLRGEGLPSAEPAGARGDVLVVVRVVPDPRFMRDGTELFRNETIGVADAVLGTKLEVPTLDGGVTVKVPPGTQPGSVLRVRGKGLPRLGGGHRGNLNIVVDVRIPDHPSAEERRLYERIRSLSAASPPGGEASRRASG